MDCKNFAALLESSCSVPLCCETLENTNLFDVSLLGIHCVVSLACGCTHIWGEVGRETEIAGGRGRERGSWFVNS